MTHWVAKHHNKELVKGATRPLTPEMNLQSRDLMPGRLLGLSQHEDRQKCTFHLLQGVKITLYATALYRKIDENWKLSATKLWKTIVLWKKIFLWFGFLVKNHCIVLYNLLCVDWRILQRDWTYSTFDWQHLHFRIGKSRGKRVKLQLLIIHSSAIAHNPSLIPVHQQ